MIRVLLVDDHLHFLEATRAWLLMNQAIDVVDAVTNAQDALERVSQLKPDVVLLDLKLGGESGLDCIPRLKQSHPQVKVIVLTMMESEPYRTAAMRAGADAFAGKSEISKALIALIQGLVNGPEENVDPSRPGWQKGVL